MDLMGKVTIMAAYIHFFSFADETILKKSLPI